MTTIKVTKAAALVKFSEVQLKFWHPCSYTLLIPLETLKYSNRTVNISNKMVTMYTTLIKQSQRNVVF